MSQQSLITRFIPFSFAIIINIVWCACVCVLLITGIIVDAILIALRTFGLPETLARYLALTAATTIVFSSLFDDCLDEWRVVVVVIYC